MAESDANTAYKEFKSCTKQKPPEQRWLTDWYRGWSEIDEIYEPSATEQTQAMPSMDLDPDHSVRGSEDSGNQHLDMEMYYLPVETAEDTCDDEASFSVMFRGRQGPADSQNTDADQQFVTQPPLDAINSIRGHFATLCNHRLMLSFHLLRYREESQLLKQEHQEVDDVITLLRQMSTDARGETCEFDKEGLANLVSEIDRRNSRVNEIQNRIDHVSNQISEEEKLLRMVELQLHDELELHHFAGQPSDIQTLVRPNQSPQSGSSYDLIHTGILSGSIARESEPAQTVVEVFSEDAYVMYDSQNSTGDEIQDVREDEPLLKPDTPGLGSNSEGDILMAGEVFDMSDWPLSPQDAERQDTDSLLAMPVQVREKRMFDLGLVFTKMASETRVEYGSTRPQGIGPALYEMYHIVTSSWLEFSRFLYFLFLYGKEFVDSDYENIDRELRLLAAKRDSALYKQPVQSLLSEDELLRSAQRNQVETSAQATMNSGQTASRPRNAMSIGSLHNQQMGRSGSDRWPGGTVMARMPFYQGRCAYSLPGGR